MNDAKKNFTRSFNQKRSVKNICARFHETYNDFIMALGIIF